MSELHQQVWDFVYDLLPEDEANAMRERISSDPDVARAYADVKLQSEVLGRASRWDTEQMVWARPGGSPVTDQSPSPASQEAARATWRQTASWVVSLAAAALFCVMAWPLVVSESDRIPQVAQTPAAAVATPQGKTVRTVLAGPTRLDAESATTFAVRTTTAEGAPVETEVLYRWYDQSDRLAYADSSRTDSSGTLLLEIPSTFAKQRGRLELGTANGTKFLTRPLEVSEAKQMNYLRLDRPLFRPGDSVKYRSVTLSRLGLEPADETEVHYFVATPDGDVLPQSERTSPATDGVGAGEVELPEDASDGTYALVAQSPRQRFAEEWRDFEVRRYRTPRFKQTLDLAKDSYKNGETVEADLIAEYAIGGAVANADVKAEVRFDDERVAIPATKTDENGAAKLAFRVPDTIQNNRGTLSVTIADADGDETISEDVPVNVGKVNVEFYPEGGKLVAGLPNRLYFYGRDPYGKPVHIEGAITEGSDNFIGQVATLHEGRGVVEFTPQVELRYRLSIQEPDGNVRVFDLPPVDPQQHVVMQTGSGVFAADDPIDLTIMSKRQEIPLVVAGYCRGAMVGQSSVEEADYEIAQDGVASADCRLDLSPDAQGVIRVTVFDGSQTPVVPIAERLVYRDVRKELRVTLSGQQASYPPGSTVELQVAVTDEADVPQPAVLGLSVVDDAVLSLGKDKSTRLPTYFHLLTDIENPQDLEDANFYLSSKEGAAQALDLLLGTQGWRRFVEVDRAEQLARLDDQSATWLGRKSQTAVTQGTTRYAFVNEFELPFLAVQQSEPQPAHSQRVVPMQRTKREAADTSGMILVVGGAGLLLLLAVLGSVRTGLRFKVWGPAGALAAVALLVGWMSAPLSPKASSGSMSADRTAPMELAAKSQAGAEAMDEVGLYADAAAETESPVGDAESKQLSDEIEMDSLELQQAAPQDAAPAMERAVAGDEPAERARAAPAPRPTAEPSAEAAMPAADLSLPSRNVKRFSFEPRKTAGVAAAPESFKQSDVQRGDRVLREFAYFARPVETDSGLLETPATIYWQPYLKLGDSGDTPITFDLPSRETTYRVIVEAHGSGRLGAAEALIICKAAE